MAISMKNVDVAFQGLAAKPGTEIWRIENFSPVSLSKSDYGKFYSGDSYIVLRTTALKSGAFHYDVHFWLGKDTSQDEAGAAAIKTVELDAALGGRAVQYRETQGHETDLFLSYFKPCIIPLEGGVKSGFKNVAPKAYEPSLFLCRGARVARITQVPFTRQSLNHDDIFVLDTKEKVFQFNGANSNLRERAQALEVVQRLKEANHGGTCSVVIVDDGKLVAESDAGEFWGHFGGFAPLAMAKKSTGESETVSQTGAVKLFCVVDGKLKESEGISDWKRSLLDTLNSYLVDSGSVVYVWNGRATSLEKRKAATLAAENFISSQKRPPSTRVTRLIEGFETPQFKSLFQDWPTLNSSLSEDGRGKVAALLKQQGLNVKGLVKGAPTTEIVPPVLLDSSGKLEVWRVEGQSKTVVSPEDHGKFCDAYCYIVLYTYHGERKEEYFLCSWLGEKHTTEDEGNLLQLNAKMAKNLKGRAVQARVFQGKEPPQFLALFPCFIIYKDSCNFELSRDATYFLRVDGTASYNSRTTFVEPAALSLNSSECFILLSGKRGYTWYGSFSTAEQQKLSVDVTSFLKVSTKPIKEGTEPGAFWDALDGKQTGYPAHQEVKDISKDPRLFHCLDSGGKLETKEVFNFDQDDLLTEDVMILDTYAALYVWVGQHASADEKLHSFDFAKEYLDVALGPEGVSAKTPLFRIPEGFEPNFFTTYFDWDSAKASVIANTYQKRLAALQQQKIQQDPGHNSRTQRKTAMVALNSVFTPQSADPSTPSSGSPKVSPSRINPTSSQRSAAMAALNSAFTPQTADAVSPKTPSSKSAPVNLKSQRAAALAALSSVLIEPIGDQNGFSSPIDRKVSALGKKLESLDQSSEVSEDEHTPDINTKEPSDEQAPIAITKEPSDEHAPADITKERSDKKNAAQEEYPYNRLKVTSAESISEIDPKRREAYLSTEEFVKLFGMEKVDFYGLPRWKQEQRKRALDLF